jgi:hypothetical protein
MQFNMADKTLDGIQLSSPNTCCIDRPSMFRVPSQVLLVGCLGRRA